MSENEVVPTNGTEMSDEQIVGFTQGVRKKLVDEITQNGSTMPSDKGDRLVLLTALTDMDRTAVAKMKIGSKERQGNADREAALIAAKLGARYGAQSPFAIRKAADDVVDGEFEEVKPPTLDDAELPELELNPGETEVGVSTLGYDEFMQQMEGGAPAA